MGLGLTWFQGSSQGALPGMLGSSRGGGLCARKPQKVGGAQSKRAAHTLVCPDQ